MKKSRTKYSKINKQFNKLINAEGSQSNDNLIKSSATGLGDIANEVGEIMKKNSIKRFFDFGYENIFIETEELYIFLRDTKIITHGDISAQFKTEHTHN